ncbi:MAG: tripartite tricarboxylate transporter TctB family protein [Tessaracoccus sp.]
MSTQDSKTMAPSVQPVPRWHTGRSELFVAAGVIVLAVVMTIGTMTMEVPAGAAFPGPQFFPTIVTGLLYVVGVALAIEVLRSPRRTHVANDPVEMSDDMLADLGSLDDTSEFEVVAPEEQEPKEPEETSEPPIDWKTLGIVLGALVAFILLLPVLGWLIGSAALFWVVSWAFGSQRPIFDIAVSALFAAITQLAFSAGLGLPLPAGILEGLFPWTN